MFSDKLSVLFYKCTVKHKEKKTKVLMVAPNMGMGGPPGGYGGYGMMNGPPGGGPMGSNPYNQQMKKEVRRQIDCL